MNRVKKLRFKKTQIARLVTVLKEDEKRKVIGGIETDPGTTFIRVFC